MALMVGVGAATAIGGAVTGTLFPQVFASINLLNINSARALDSALGIKLVNAIIILIGTLSTLAYFHFGIKSSTQPTSQVQLWLKSIGQVGQVFITITLGFLFAGIYSAAMVALIDRMLFLVNFVRSVLLPLISSF